MANFFGGDFHSFPQSRRGKGRGKTSQPPASFTVGGSKGGREQQQQQGVGQWGRQQLAFPAAPAGHDSNAPVMGAGRGRGSGGGNGGGWGGTGAQFNQDSTSPKRTAIQDLSPHLANTVSTKYGLNKLCDYCYVT